MSAEQGSSSSKAGTHSLLIPHCSLLIMVREFADREVQPAAAGRKGT